MILSYKSSEIVKKIPNIEFNWWEENTPLIREIEKLKSIHIGDQKQVHLAIEILEALDRNFYGLLMDHDIFFDENEIESILALYRKSLNVLKKYEGTDISKASRALDSCLRLIQLILGLLYDCYKETLVGIELPKVLKELI
jgi:hypothetical protein